MGGESPRPSTPTPEPAVGRTFPADERIVYTNYGRTAFEAVLRSRDLTGATVIFPALICSEGFERMIRDYDLDPIFVDVDPRTYHANFDDAKRRAPDADALVLVHTFGVPADADRWRRLADDHDLLLVEDCARALGATEAGRPVGSVGDFAIYSLPKVSPAVGGGALVGPVERAELALGPPRYDVKHAHPLLPGPVEEVARFGYRGVRSLAAAADGFGGADGSGDAGGSDDGTADANGSNGGDADASASASPPPRPRELDRLNEFVFRYHLRRGFADRLRRNAEAVRRVRPPLEALGVEFQATRGECPFHFLAMTVPSGRDEVATRLADDGVPVETCWKSPLAAAFTDLSAYPTTKRLTETLLQLPLFEMTDDEVTRAIGLVSETLAARRDPVAETP